MLIRTLIIEDEPATARNLEHLLTSVEPAIKIEGVLTSVKESVQWLKEYSTSCDLIFMDIRLSDGISFEIFEKITFHTPVIFVTAYHEHALQAFKANGID
jgi:two-component system response regulator LytT